MGNPECFFPYTFPEWLEANKLHLCHVFTVDDLNHLYRGGRVSRTAAFLGTLANIKPMLHVDDEGHLIALSKVRGRKKSISRLVDWQIHGTTAIWV